MRLNYCNCTMTVPSETIGAGPPTLPTFFAIQIPSDPHVFAGSDLVLMDRDRKAAVIRSDSNSLQIR